MMKEKILILIAHPDDETLYFNQGITELKENFDLEIACATYSKNCIRGKEFLNCCNKLGVKSILLECHDIGYFSLLPDLYKRLKKLIRYGQYTSVITHSPDGGEKPHPHHIQLNILCHYICKKFQIDFKFFSEKKELHVFFGINNNQFFINYIKIFKTFIMKNVGVSQTYALIDLFLKSLYLTFFPQKKFQISKVFVVNTNYKRELLRVHKSQLHVIEKYQTPNNSFEYLWN